MSTQDPSGSVGRPAPADRGGILGVTKRLLSGGKRRAVLGTFGLKVANTALMLVAHAWLARWLGAERFGIYAYCLAWINLLTLPVLLGLDKIVIRDTARLSHQGDWSAVRATFRRSNQLVVTTALAAAGIAASVAYFAYRDRPAMQIAFIAAMAAVPLLALSRIRQAVLQGLRRVVTANVPEMFVLPVLFLALLGLSHAAGLPNAASLAILLRVLATGAAFALGAFLLLKALPAKNDATGSATPSGKLLRQGLPMAFIGVMYLLQHNLDLLMLEWLSDTRSVGIYAVATRGAGLVAFALMAVNKVVGPEFSTLFAAGDKTALQRLVGRSALGLTVLSLPITLGLLVGGRWLLSLFGPEFGEGYVALCILGIAQLISALAGSVGLLLMMSGSEKIAARNVAISTAVNLVLNLVLIPRFGIEGAAIATGTSIILVNLMQAWTVHRTLGITPSILGLRRRDGE